MFPSSSTTRYTNSSLSIIASSSSFENSPVFIASSYASTFTTHTFSFLSMYTSIATTHHLTPPPSQRATGKRPFTRSATKAAKREQIASFSFTKKG